MGAEALLAVPEALPVAPVKSATLVIWFLAGRGPTWWNTSRTDGCTRSYSSEGGADQRVRHSGFSIPSVSFSLR
ncbi:hypothetical protein AB0N62_38505 [Streptomyces sp. NPDC093982]|uniref:hypothetical protein n=1 Tax=Streptomyces sp. NPDC093982 TaxID=3155077 RepID=UPI0034262560